MEPQGEETPIAVTVPLFLKKLWKMVNDKNAEDIISWNLTGDGFVIYDQLNFITKLLPQYFKHNNMASFVRQLNFYDFHKVASIDKEEIHFTHNYFLKDLPETLVFIKRKCANSKSKMQDSAKEEEINELLVGVKEIKNKHLQVDNELKMLKQENSSLWNEINNLRNKYSKQTKIINKLIHFLISYMHSHQSSLSKRHGSSSRKNIVPKNHGPTILEIDYHQNQLETESPDIPTEPSGSDFPIGSDQFLVEDESEYDIFSDEKSDEPNTSAANTHENMPPQEFNDPEMNVSVYNILANPKESLGLYIDKTQSELNSLQEILKNLNSNDLVNLYGIMNEENKSGVASELNLDDNIPIGSSKQATAGSAPACISFNDNFVEELSKMPVVSKEDIMEQSPISNALSEALVDEFFTNIT